MVSEDTIGKVEDSVPSQSKDNTYYTVCKDKELKPIEDYEKELEYVYKRVSEDGLEAQRSLEELLNRMKKLDYSLISEDVKREYGYFICSPTETFYYGILEGINSSVDNKKENIDNLKIALEYLMSENRLERFLEAYLKRVEEKFYKETGYTIYTISWLAEIAYKTVKLLRDRGFRHIEHLLNIREKKALQYLNTLTKLSMEESEKVADIVKNLIKHPEQYKKDFEEYIEYKPEK